MPIHSNVRPSRPVHPTRVNYLHVVHRMMRWYDQCVVCDPISIFGLAEVQLNWPETIVDSFATHSPCLSDGKQKKKFIILHRHWRIVMTNLEWCIHAHTNTDTHNESGKHVWLCALYGNEKSNRHFRVAKQMQEFIQWLKNVHSAEKFYFFWNIQIKIQLICYVRVCRLLLNYWIGYFILHNVSSHWFQFAITRFTAKRGIFVCAYESHFECLKTRYLMLNKIEKPWRYVPNILYTAVIVDIILNVTSSHNVTGLLCCASVQWASNYAFSENYW